MWVGSTSSPVTGAVGLFGFRNGSISTRAVPSLSSKQLCPSHLMSIVNSPPRRWWSELVGERPADRDPDHHRDPGLLGEEDVDRGGPLVGVVDRDDPLELR